MRILAADDEPLMLDMLTDRIRQACPQGEVHAFSSARKLLEWVEENGGAFDVQEIKFDVKPTDVKLDMIITESRILR